MADTRWIFSKDGEPLFYRIEDNIFAPNGSRAFWVSGQWWFSDQSKQNEFYESGTWIFDTAGSPQFYYS